MRGPARVADLYETVAVMGDWFLTGDDLGYLVEVLVTFVGYGLGLGAVLWLFGAVVHVIWDFVRY